MINPLAACLLVSLLGAPSDAARQKPNIVFILCDDLGYGDVHALNPQHGKIPTPCMDRFAAQGMVFTEAHSSSALCSPTRYGVLTGRYDWRSRLQYGVLGGYSPPLIAADRLTVAKLLKQQGYATACIGKWHLGMTMPTRPGVTFRDHIKVRDLKHLDPNKPIADGPTTRGFDYYFGISASLDMSPFALIENDHFTQPPTVIKKLTVLERDVRDGPGAPDFEFVDVLPTLTTKAVDFISQHAPRKQPYFLYLPLNAPHTPLAVTKQWQGKSGLNTYGDYVMETDAMIGRVLDAVDKSGAAGNTLVFVTSDNGCAPYVGVEELEAKGHFPSGDRRGYKADAWDGGHHIPLMVRWPGVVKPGGLCKQLVCLNDLMATSAEILGVKVPDNAGEDSVSFLPLLRGSNQPVREAVIHHSGSGKFAVRDGKWKLLLCSGSGGWGKPTDLAATRQGLPSVQLYDTVEDVGERENLVAKHPKVATRLAKLLEKYVADGRSTPGALQKNDVPIDLFKGAKIPRQAKVKKDASSPTQ